MDKATGKYPAFYGIDCSHPSWFIHLFDVDEAWVKRIHYVSGNGSKKAHEELDECDALDTSDPKEFGALMGQIKRKPNARVRIFRGCCGTDERHLEEIAKSIADMLKCTWV